MNDTHDSDLGEPAHAQPKAAVPAPGGPGPTGALPGPGRAHGHAVHSVKEPNPKVNAQFDPGFLCVVYLRFEANQLLTTRYGYVEETGLLDPAKVEATAMWALAALRADDASRFHQQTIYYDLEFISLGQQLILILFVDNNPDQVKFEHINGLDYVVRFSELSAVQPDHPTHPIQMNNAFFNLMTFAVTGLTGKEACRIDYWDTNADGEVSDPAPGQTDKYRRYSMNIHLRMAIATSTLEPSGRWIPLVIDPDTGNMGGGP